MTAQLLPPIISSPFGDRFDTSPYSFDVSASLQGNNASSSAPAVNAFGFQRPRQASPASIFSVASAPNPSNNENVAPTWQHDDFTQATFRSVSPTQQNCTSSKDRNQSHGYLRPATSTADHRQTRTTVRKGPVAKRILPPASNEDVSLLQKALMGIETYQIARSGAITPSTPSAVPQQERQGQSSTYTGHTEELNTAKTVSSGARPDAALPPAATPSTAIDDTSIVTSTPIEQTPTNHHNRFSTNSSGLVHTVKTASFSHGSFSVLSKSFQLGQSSETRALFSSHSRFSSESERPSTNHSVDEAAICRSFKRRQILDEMLTTEETYIADLKALVYLMSTLLASSTSISSRLRHSMQQNVLDLLHLHEGILENLHRAAFKSAARKWAETISPTGASSPRQARWRMLEPSVAGKLARVHHRTRSSTDSHEFTRTRARLMGAEPIDVADTVSIFNTSISNFFAYEEYCANHEIIAHDLQRHLPTLWSTYGTGIESLARSLVSLDRRREDGRKALTVGDLLIKPIQRICKYPLLFEDLLKQTPVSDCPSAHADLESILRSLRDIVDAVNHATRNQDARLHIHRRWALQARLNVSRTKLVTEDLRLLGDVILCGVLHVTYQTRARVDGSYALCVLYQNVLLVAFPAGPIGRFDVMALVMLNDMKLESASDGKGLQTSSALHTWKLCFAVEGNLHEFVLSACSAVEEDQWRKGLCGEISGERGEVSTPPTIQSSVALELTSVGVVYGHHGTLARRLSIQRAATVGNRASIHQVILRNTHSPEELHEIRQPSTSSINRSHSHMTTNRIVVLAPKRSERARLETMLGDVWTKDKLPYPGMIASRGGQIIRASAGSLVRKLSLASIHAPFSRRSASLTVSSKQSYETFSEMTSLRNRAAPTFEIRRDSLDDRPALKPTRKSSHDLPELDTMDSVINRMIGDTKAPSLSSHDGIKRRGTLHKSPIKVTALPVGPDDSAEDFYPEKVEKMQKHVGVESALTGSKKKRWSNPFGMLKGPFAEGVRHMMYSTIFKTEEDDIDADEDELAGDTTVELPRLDLAEAKWIPSLGWRRIGRS